MSYERLDRRLASAELELNSLERARDEQTERIDREIRDAELAVEKIGRERRELTDELLAKPVDMFVYLISQKTNNGWETYDSAVVIARDAILAGRMDPGGDDPNYSGLTHWTDASNVTVKMVGRASPSETRPRVVCSSYNAG